MLNEFIRLIFMGAVFVLMSSGLYYIEKTTAFAKLPYWKKQILFGSAFGVLAIAATETSIELGGAALNIRDAAPILAGLIFGGPAGILAGLIGGIERWFASLWGVGTYTRTACSIAAVVAGVSAAGIHRYLLERKKPTWIYGLSVTVVIEVFHMLLVFLTNMDDISVAFTFVQSSALPMILTNGMVVALSIFLISCIGKEYFPKYSNIKKISQTFQLWLCVCVVVGFFITSTFTYHLQTRISSSDTKQLLNLNLEDVKNEIHDASNQNLLALTNKIANEVTKSADDQMLYQLMKKYDVSEINLIDENGCIIATTNDKFHGFDMASGKQSSEFLVLLENVQEYVQDYQATSSDPSIFRKYAGVKLPFGGFIQVAYDAERFQRDIDVEVVHAANNRHIGQSGSIIICDESFRIISDNERRIGAVLDLSKLTQEANSLMSFEPFEAEVYGVDSYCAYTYAEGYYILAVLPKAEATFSRDIAVYILVFMEILVFAALFAYIYFLIRKLIVNNLQKVNHSLSLITHGNLNEVVDVRSNEEFASLSDDINATVATLKRYISEAEARIDQELEYARTIQYSALPSVFPPYPNREEFDIYASMVTAKEVGGDFYDFYFIDDTKLAFLVADVSGKGIPAAMFMMRAKALLKSLVESGNELSEAFRRANNRLCEGNDAEMFVTAWLGVLDVTSGHVEFVNAGHNPPMILHKEHAAEVLKTKANFILGMMEDMPYKKYELDLNPGDIIFLYTDGLTEAHNMKEDLYGEDRLKEFLNNHGNADCSVTEMCQMIYSDLQKFVDAAEQSDDITMLGLQYHGRKHIK